jgi:hypothetical protein
VGAGCSDEGRTHRRYVNLMATPRFYRSLNNGSMCSGAVFALQSMKCSRLPIPHETQPTQESQKPSWSCIGKGRTGELRNNLIRPTQWVLLLAPTRQVTHVGKFLIRNPCISNRACSNDHGRETAWFSWVTTTMSQVADQGAPRLHGFSFLSPWRFLYSGERQLQLRFQDTRARY